MDWIWEFWLLVCDETDVTYVEYSIMCAYHWLQTQDSSDLLARGSRLQNALVDFSQISNKSQSNKFYTFKEDGQTVEIICAAIYEPVA